MEELEKSFLSVNQSVGKCLICNKNIRANDASSLTDDEWKKLTNLVKTWRSVVLLIDHQYYEYTQVHELIGNRKTAFCKQYLSRNCRPTFERHSLINKLKKDNETDLPGAEAATTLTSLPLDASLLSLRSSTTRTQSSTGNTKQFEQIYLTCNKICPCDSNAYNEGGWGVCEFKSARDRLMGAPNATG